MKSIRQLEQAFHELVNPGLGQASRQGERQECGDRIATHGGDVAETAGKAAMANRLGGMPFAPEMNPFQAEIGSHQQLVTRGGLENGAIVSDTSDHALSSGGAFADARDQQLFGEWQDGLNI